jgi:peptide/nickel transport system permease protein
MRLVARRVAPGLLLILAASVLILAGTETLPGDVAQSIPGLSATPQALANLRAEMGLDRPAAERSFAWLAGAVQGDFGEALSNRQDIATAMGQRLGNTLFLAFRAAVFAVPLAILVGLIAVRYRGRRRDRLISGATLATVSVPEFLLG